MAPTHKISDDARWDVARPTAPPVVSANAIPRKSLSQPQGTYQAPVHPPSNPMAQALPPMSRPQPVAPLSVPPQASQPPIAARDYARLDTDPVAPSGPPSQPRRISHPPSVPPPPQARVVSSVSASMKPARTRWGVIMLVLIVDLGLAAAGVIMLREGLRESASPSGGSATAGSATGATTEVTPATAVAKAEPAKPKPADPPPIVEPAKDTKVVEPDAKVVETADTKVVETKKADPVKAARAATKTHGTGHHGPQGSGGPLDPYAVDPEPPAAIDLGAQVDALVARTRPAADGCYAGATKGLAPDQLPHGAIKIAFRVQPDGKLQNAAVVENGTGSEPLAGCVVAEVGTWVLPAHAGAPVDFVRAFTF